MATVRLCSSLIQGVGQTVDNSHFDLIRMCTDALTDQVRVSTRPQQDPAVAAMMEEELFLTSTINRLTQVDESLRASVSVHRLCTRSRMRSKILALD